MKTEKSLLAFLNDILPRIGCDKITNVSQYMDLENDKVLNDFYKSQIEEIDWKEHNFGCDEMYGVSYCIKEFTSQPDISYSYMLLGAIIFSCIAYEDYDMIELMRHPWATLYVINCIISISAEDVILKNTNIHPDARVSIGNAISTLRHNYKQEYVLLESRHKKILS